MLAGDMWHQPASSSQPAAPSTHMQCELTWNLRPSCLWNIPVTYLFTICQPFLRCYKHHITECSDPRILVYCMYDIHCMIRLLGGGGPVQEWATEDRCAHPTRDALQRRNRVVRGSEIMPMACTCMDSPKFDLSYVPVVENDIYSKKFRGVRASSETMTTLLLWDRNL